MQLYDLSRWNEFRRKSTVLIRHKPNWWATGQLQIKEISYPKDLKKKHFRQNNESYITIGTLCPTMGGFT